MFLHRVQPDPRCREARRDLADPYQMHATLCRAFHVAEGHCPPGAFLWRQESHLGPDQAARLLVQGRIAADWSRIGISGWIRQVDPALDLAERLKLSTLVEGQRFIFRLRANPVVTRNGKRLGLLKREDQEKWLLRKAELHGFSISGGPEADGGNSIRISQEQMLTGRKHDGTAIRIYSVLFDGVLQVTQVESFRSALRSGIGHGKALGLGLLSVAPVR